MKNRSVIAQLLVKELTLYTQARASKNHEQCVYHLGRAHILSQYKWFHHFYVHFLMFEYSWSRSDWKEICPQIIRMAATIPGHMFKKLPKGNTGWSSVGLTQEIALPEDFKKLFLD